MTRLLFGILAAVALTACGTTRTERGLSGAAIGAGLGAVAGEAFGDSPGKGAIIGGAAGAATGVLSADDNRNDQGRSYDDDDCYYDRTRGRYYCDRD
jgi:uncharacterized protein YcfJ